MDAEQEPLNLVHAAVGSDARARVLMVTVTMVWGFTWTWVDVEVSLFGLLALPLSFLVGLAGFATIPFVYAELRARRVLSAARVVQDQAGCSGVDVWVRQVQFGTSVAPQRLRISDGQLWIDDTWWDANSVTVQHGFISRWRRGVPMTLAGYQVWLSVFPKEDPASFALWGAIAVDRSVADAVEAALHPHLSTPPARHEHG